MNMYFFFNISSEYKENRFSYENRDIIIIREFIYNSFSKNNTIFRQKTKWFAYVTQGAKK